MHAQLDTVVEELSYIPQLESAVTEAVWSTLVTADGTSRLVDIFSVGASWSRTLSLSDAQGMPQQLTAAWCAEAALVSSSGDVSAKSARELVN